MNNKRPNIKKIKLIVYDFDGVMTDNRALLFPDGTEAVYVNRGDGLAISIFKKRGISQAIISTEKNIIVQTRAEKLAIPVYQGIENKLNCIKKVIESFNSSREETLYVGNDINDMEAMEYVAWPVAPSDASKIIRKTAVVVTKARGGEGVIRELLDIIKFD